VSASLRISPTFTLPIDAATQTFAFIARKGGGKTYTAGVLVEELLTARVQVVVLDTVGNWYGLRMTTAGKPSAFDVPVLGGLRGDSPLEATGGALIADIVVDTGKSLVLDISQYSLADRKRFATAFGERLWLRKKGERTPAPLHLVIEESQLIVPQFTGAGGDVARMLGIYEEIIRLGRNYGIGVSMITQRPQSVNKEVLNQTECLFVGQVNGSQERDALKKWITHQGMNVHLLDELPSLPVGTFFVWSPQWLGILEKVKIGKKATFDASATPKVGDTRTVRDLQPLDLKDLQQQLAATIQRAKADDPRELRKEIAQLQRQLAEKPAAAPERVEVPVLSEEDRRRIDTYLQEMRSTGIAIEVAQREISCAMERAERPGFRATPAAQKAPKIEIVRAIQPKKPHTGDLDAPQQAILDVVNMLDYRGISANRDTVARWLGIHPNGGRYGSNLAHLRGAGYLDGFDLTSKSQRDRADVPLPIGLDGIYAVPKFDVPKRTIVHTLDTSRNHFTRESLAAALNIHPNGGRYGSNLAYLRTMGVLPERGEIYLTEAAYR
jgi:hypothetical protein